MQTTEATNSHVKRKISNAFRWTVPFTAIVAMTLSLLRLKVTPAAWTKPGCTIAEELVEIIPDPVSCAVLSSVIIVYWLAKDGRNAAQDTASIAGLLLALPGVANVYALTENVVKMGIKALLEKTKQEIREDARAKGHAEGRTEGHAKGRIEGRAEMGAEYQAWLDRRRADGNFRWDDSDPPPGVAP